MTAPFPYFGGKRRVAEQVWRRFGRADVYSEPFAGSLAVLLGNPHRPLPAKEIVCDNDGHICNVWRSMAHDPEKTAEYANWPTIHQDLNARHRWLREWADANSRRLSDDPDYYDPKAAGWWIWGLSSWIGKGWCADKRYETVPAHYGVGIGKGVQMQRSTVPFRRMDDRIGPWFRMLAERLANVIVTCGDWRLVVGNSAMGAKFAGVKCVFLDPPYPTRNRRDKRSDYYAADKNSVAEDAYEWAVENGSRYRIAYCCHKDDFPVPDGWDSSIRTMIGYATTGGPKTHDDSDLIMFSPACEKSSGTLDLFD